MSDPRSNFLSGVVMAYGAFIAHALKAKGATTQELTILRDQVRATVAAQGDLVGGLAEIEKEIERRGQTEGQGPRPKTGGEPDPASSEIGFPSRFVLQVLGVSVPAEVATRIEKRLADVALEEVARIDQSREMVATPLSEVKSWGPGLGGATAGMIVQPRF